ncbi:MAG TPA: carboxypeptidase regulatory-like domain-containing protein [Vicinamibacterales bacterium]|nr:carboxypeptidase regulatory-like domain-containing protein [Vicinamibacterales bacterium]
MLANIFLSSWARLALVGGVLTLSAVGPGAQQQRAAASLPVVIAGRWPQVNSIGAQANSSATVVARVTTDGEQVASVEVVRPAVLLTEDVVASIKTWKFEPHAPTTFETTFRFGRRTAEPRCYNDDRNAHLSSRLPLELTVESTRTVICDPSVSFGRLQSKVARGRVVCKCPNERPLAGVLVQLKPQSNYRLVGETLTNRDGWFDLGNVQPDSYYLELSAAGYYYSNQALLVSPGVAESELTVELERDTNTVPPAAATVLPGALVTYPESARRANVEGIVRMRMSTEGTVMVLDGPFELREAAISNVRSWKFQEAPSRPFEIRYRYQLLAAACNAEPSPAVTMRPPYDVEIVAKRIIRCG